MTAIVSTSLNDLAIVTERPQDDFERYLQRAIDESALDFDIVLKPKTWTGETVTIAGLTIPRFNELLVREAWFEGYVNRQLLKITEAVDSDAFPEFLSALADYMNLPGPKEALEFLRSNNKTEEETAAFNLFGVFNSKLMARVNLANSLGGEQFILALRITFFIRSRVNANFSFGDAMELLSGEMTALTEFIQLEANKGIPLKVLNSMTDPNADKGK
jgi:hypothetical protein